jgi:hypothetical protein
MTDRLDGKKMRGRPAESRAQGLDLKSSRGPTSAGRARDEKTVGKRQQPEPSRGYDETEYRRARANALGYLEASRSGARPSAIKSAPRGPAKTSDRRRRPGESVKRKS